MQSKIEILEEVLKTVFENNNKQCPSLTDETLLDASFGLDSLDWAEFVVRYQKRTGCDILANQTAPLRTYSDLLKLL